MVSILEIVQAWCKKQSAEQLHVTTSYDDIMSGSGSIPVADELSSDKDDDDDADDDDIRGGGVVHLW